MAAEIVKAWKEDGSAFAVFRVAVHGRAVELPAVSTPLLDSAGQPKALAVLKSELAAAGKAAFAAEASVSKPKGQEAIAWTGTVEMGG